MMTTIDRLERAEWLCRPTFVEVYRKVWGQVQAGAPAVTLTRTEYQVAAEALAVEELDSLLGLPIRVRPLKAVLS